MYIRIRSQWGVMRTNIHKEQKTLIAYFTIKGYSRRKVFMVSKVYLSMVNIPEEQAGMLALQFPGPSHKPSCFWPLSLCSASRYIHNFVQPVTYAFSSVAWRHRQSAYSIIVNGTFVYRGLKRQCLGGTFDGVVTCYPQASHSHLGLTYNEEHGPQRWTRWPNRLWGWSGRVVRTWPSLLWGSSPFGIA